MNRSGADRRRSRTGGMGNGFMKRLIQSVLTALILSGVFCITLVLGMKVLRERFLLKETGTAMQAIGHFSEMPDERMKVLLDVAVQAVFVTGEDGDLCSCFYTMLDCMENRLEIYVIPSDTRLQLSAGLYQELVTKNTKLAQVNTLDGLYRCFDKAEAAECTVQALEEAIGITADYITVMPKSCYDRLMKEEPHTYAYDDFLQDDLRENVMASGSMKAYLTGIWEECESSAALESKLYYLETYEGLTNLTVSCRMIAGERHNNGYVLSGGFR